MRVAAPIAELTEAGVLVAHIFVQRVTVRQGGDRVERQLAGGGVARVFIGDLRARPRFHPVDHSGPRGGTGGGKAAEREQSDQSNHGRALGELAPEAPLRGALVGQGLFDVFRADLVHGVGKKLGCHTSTSCSVR